MELTEGGLDLGEILGGIVGGVSPLVAGLFVLLAGIFGSNQKTVGALPMFVLALLGCAATWVFAPDTGFWTSVERIAWWGGGLLGGLGAVIAFNQKGGGSRALACLACLGVFAGVALYSPSSPEVRLERIAEQRAELEAQLDESIPQLIDQQSAALADVRSELADEALTAVRQRELEAEARDIVRFVMALERHRDDSQETLSRLRSLERTLARQASAEELLGGSGAILDEYEAISQEAGARLAVQLDPAIGTGAIADAEVEARYRELLGE